MRLTALQLPARHGDFTAQVRLAETLLETGPKTDLVLLPEAAFTGYVSPQGDFGLTRFAEPLEGRAHEALQHLARRFDALLVGPVIERDGAQLFNSMIAVTPTGERLLHYRKHHPWYPEVWATPGHAPAPVFEWRGTRITAAICFDVHFLGAEAASPLREADLLLFSSAWVDDGPGLDSRPGHLQSLAVEFDVAVLNANWGDGDPSLYGQGGSLAMTHRGAVLQRLGDGAARLDVELSSLR